MSSNLLFTLFIIASFPTATPFASFRGTTRPFLDTAVDHNENLYYPWVSFMESQPTPHYSNG